MIYYIYRIINVALAIIFNKKIILTRCACLGLDALKGKKIYNIQKQRLDNLNNINFFNILLLRRLKIRKSIRKLIVQQALKFNPIIIRQSDYFVMDTYSELTDKLFKFNNLSFYAHYSDFSEKNNLSGQEIDIKKIKDIYLNFFKWMKVCNSKIKIIVINFPVKFDKREEYKNRHNLILNALKKIEDIYLVEIPDFMIIKSDLDNYPYHFSDVTIGYVRNEILKILNEQI